MLGIYLLAGTNNIRIMCTRCSGDTRNTRHIQILANLLPAQTNRKICRWASSTLPEITTGRHWRLHVSFDECTQAASGQRHPCSAHMLIAELEEMESFDVSHGSAPQSTVGTCDRKEKRSLDDCTHDLRRQVYCTQDNPFFQGKRNAAAAHRWDSNPRHSAFWNAWRDDP